MDTLNSVAGYDSIVTTYLVVDNILYGNDTAVFVLEIAFYWGCNAINSGTMWIL